MANGTVKWFNAQKGFAFIQHEAGGKGVFVDVTAMERAGISSLSKGQGICFDIVSERGKRSRLRSESLSEDFPQRPGAKVPGFLLEN